MKILPPYFSHLLGEIIDGPGQYRTRCGEIVTITGKSSRHRHWDGRYSCFVPEDWHESGRRWTHAECDNDIVEKVNAHPDT